jgi:hypothetical protein
VIDFRYHLISIVAVLLALSVGVVLGTGAVGGPLLDDLKQNVSELSEQNEERLSEISDLQGELRAERRFAEGAEDYLVDGVLSQQAVVLVEFEGVAEDVVEALTTTIGQAGGVVTSTIKVQDKIGLVDEIQRDELALILGSAFGEPDDLRIEAAEILSSRLGAAAKSRPAAAARERLESFLADLEQSGFVEVTRSDSKLLVPRDASFVLVGGAIDPLSFDISAFSTALASGLATEGSGIVVAETSRSSWELVTAVLNDDTAREQVATVEGVDEAAGRTAAILTLACSQAGTVGHFGIGPGTDEVIPEPTTCP